MDWWPRYDGPIPEESEYISWFRQVEAAALEFGKPIAGVVRQIQSSIESVGFEVISHKRETLHVSVTCRVQRHHMHACLALRHFELLSTPTLGHLEGLSMRLLTQKGWTTREVRAKCEAVRAELEKVDGSGEWRTLWPYHKM